MTDSADWLPYSIVRSQPANSGVVNSGAGILVSGGPPVSTVVAALANRQARITRLDLYNLTAAPLIWLVTSATGNTISGSLGPLEHDKPIDEVPVDWPVGEAVLIGGQALWADCSVSYTALYVYI